MDSSGSLDRCIEVVCIQCGTPNATTTAQNAKMISRRVHIVIGFSAGGITLTDAASVPLKSFPLPASVAIR